MAAQDAYSPGCQDFYDRATGAPRLCRLGMVLDFDRA